MKTRKSVKRRSTKGREKASKPQPEKRVLTTAELEEKILERKRKKAVRDKNRRMRDSVRVPRRTAGELVADEIERETKCGEGFGRERKLGIDLAILAGFADPDEIENEERICCHSNYVSKHDDDVADGEVEAFLEGGSFEDRDFRDGIKLHDPHRPSHRLKLKSHPECGEDEVYLLSVTRKGFGIIRWETKRMGRVTSCGCYPVFVRRDELTTAGYRLMKPRRSKVQAVA